MALLADSVLLRIAPQYRWMPNPVSSRIVDRAKELLWVIARCDVENLNSHRATALQHLRDLECQAAAIQLDLYSEVLLTEE